MRQTWTPRVWAARSSSAQKVQIFEIKRLQTEVWVPAGLSQGYSSQGSHSSSGSVVIPAGPIGNVELHCSQAVCSPSTARACASGAQLAGLCGVAAHQLWAKPHFRFVIVGGFVPKQVRQMQAVLTHLPFKHCGAITFRNSVERLSQCEETAQIASSVSVVLL